VTDTVAGPGQSARSRRTCRKALAGRSHGTTTRRMSCSIILAFHAAGPVADDLVGASTQTPIEISRHELQSLHLLAGPSTCVEKGVEHPSIHPVSSALNCGPAFAVKLRHD